MKYLENFQYYNVLNYSEYDNNEIKGYSRGRNSFKHLVIAVTVRDSQEKNMEY